MDTRDNLLWLHICSYWSTVNKQTWQTQSRAWKVDTISATNSSECLLFSLFFFMVCVSSILCYHPLNQHFNTHYSKYSLFTVINLKSQEKYIERGREKHDREIKIERLCVFVSMCMSRPLGAFSYDVRGARLSQPIYRRDLLQPL